MTIPSWKPWVGGHLDDTEKHLTQAEREEWVPSVQ